MSLSAEVRTYKDSLQRNQIEIEQKQRENAALKLQAQQMEEQLSNCKKMLEELKSKLQLQKDTYEKQLLHRNYLFNFEFMCAVCIFILASLVYLYCNVL
uniref:Uncharacterized protein n=1 Tax=Periophthalmus magnuspinnatus TaxID=409849 RepID=A0A3B3ZZY2_9GOBI